MLASAIMEADMPFPISTTIQTAIGRKIQQVEANGRFLNVYLAAQEIQDQHPRENIALEDIVAGIVDRASGRSLGLDLSQPKNPGYFAMEFIISGNPR